MPVVQLQGVVLTCRKLGSSDQGCSWKTLPSVDDDLIRDPQANPLVSLGLHMERVHRRVMAADDSAPPYAEGVLCKVPKASTSMRQSIYHELDAAGP